jgi:hypothetical protein
VRAKILFYSFLLPILVPAGLLQAKAPAEGRWRIAGLVQAGFALGETDWEIRHPVYSGGEAATWESISGKFLKSSRFSAGLELSKGFLGGRVEFGIISMKMTNAATGQDSKFTSYFGEIALLFFPMKNPRGRIVPYLSAGAGGFLSGGDIDNPGYHLSLGGGVRCFISDKVGIGLGLKLPLMKYHQVEIGSNITKDLSYSPFLVGLEALVRF